MGFPNDLPPARILVVDDNHNMLTLLRVNLQARSYDVQTCTDGFSALHIVGQAAPDMVLLDVAMPGLDGFEVLRTIRQTYTSTDLPVIMLTAAGETQDVVQGLRLGANDYLVKPFEEEILCARIHLHLSLKLLQDQRRKDLERLQQLDTLKNKFMLIASHDLKGPLARSLSYI